MDARTKPNIAIARKTLPPQLFKVLAYLIDQDLQDCALVGGTALSGFYTSHRRSDDIDLFTENRISQDTAILVARSLVDHSVLFNNEKKSPFYYHANCSSGGHHFTLDIVLDKNLFKVGEFHLVEGKLKIASLETILRMKSAALVSRSGEKDLYDLIQLFNIFSNLNIATFIELGQSIASGVNAESMLASVGGAILRQEACDFSLEKKITKEIVYKKIKSFQKQMIVLLQNFLKKQKTPPLGELMRYARKSLK